MKNPVRESLVTGIWIRQLFRKDRLRTADGGRLRVLHPGRQSSDCGPDLCDAIVAFDSGQPIKGDVEIHVSSSEWKAHGHQKDPNFNRVILHVVLWHRGTPYSPTEDGREVPILPLSGYLKRPLEQLSHQVEASASRERPCRAGARRRGQVATLGILHLAGEQRFALKAEQFQNSLAIGEANQVLYEGVMKALGYARNEMPFARLARLLPIERLQGMAGGGQVAAIQALVLGTAGLLPAAKEQIQPAAGFSLPDLMEIGRLTAHWEVSAGEQSMDRTDWRFFRVRPGNLPPRRIAGISHLLVRHSGDLSQNMVRLAAVPTLKQAQKTLAEGLIVRTSDYWAWHGDFGVDVPFRGAVIGQDRAADITVNVILPFLLAYGDTCGEPRLRRRAWRLYRAHRKLPDNRITRYMVKQIFGEEGSALDTACQQQGLIHLYREFCIRDECAVCPLA